VLSPQAFAEACVELGSALGLEVEVRTARRCSASA
jgi:hypothetical protein